MLKEIVNEAKMTPKRFYKKIEKIQDILDVLDNDIMDFQETDEYISDEYRNVRKEMSELYTPMDNFRGKLEVLRTALKKSN